MNISTSAASAALLVASFAFAGCRGKPVTYQSTIRIQRAVAVAFDDHQKPLSVDVPFVWAESPGEQRQTVRSGQDFAAPEGGLLEKCPCFRRD